MKNLSELAVIRAEEQYHSYISEVQELIGGAAELSQTEQNRLELLTLLIENYENTKYPIEAPDPIDAIKFRMHEKGLKQSDLTPFFGTSSRVSEVLNKKRPLTVQMIRAISVGLGISAETLIGLSTIETSSPNTGDVCWTKFPVQEMVTRGWISKVSKGVKNSIEEKVTAFINEAGLSFGVASFRKSIPNEVHSPTTQYALQAWVACVIQKARKKKDHLGRYDSNVFSNDFLRELAQLSWFEQGPLLAAEFLEKNGIAFIIEPRLRGTLLDGAALKDDDGTPIIALTLRYDRLDNFWFTLLHEAAHIWKHADQKQAILDNLDASTDDKNEAEANRLAREAFIPRGAWNRSEAFLSPSRENIEMLANKLKIHPAIIAGRLRKEKGNYSLFPDLIEEGSVRGIFLGK